MKSDLFEDNLKKLAPLAERVRPTALDDIVGQAQLTHPNSPFRKMIESGRVHSFILWGPPGTGKTSIARIVAKTIQAEFFELSAVNAGVKEVREILKKGETNLKFYQKKTVLFIDEIHRFSKNQQDALLQAVEEGSILLIGATTENPSFEIISPLLSRCDLYRLNPLTVEDLNKILRKAIAKDEILSQYSININDDVIPLFYQYAGGDARRALNLLEKIIHIVLQNENAKSIEIKKETIAHLIDEQAIRYDKSGDQHYDLISAFIKSVRGSDPDAALYWMARMLQAGEKPEFIARRLIILASEDVGNAQPSALLMANAAFDAVHKVGMPEAGIILAQATTYLASSPKSNASYMAYKKAQEYAQKYHYQPVPIHLRNAPTSLMKNLGFGLEYKYPHDFPGGFVVQNYFPENLPKKQFYYPKKIGHESKLKEYLKTVWKNKKKYDEDV